MINSTQLQEAAPVSGSPIGSPAPVPPQGGASNAPDALVSAQGDSSCWQSFSDGFWCAAYWTLGALQWLKDQAVALFSAIFLGDKKNRGVIQELTNLKKDFVVWSRVYDRSQDAPDEQERVINEFTDNFALLRESSQTEIRTKILAFLKTVDPQGKELAHIQKMNEILEKDPFYKLQDAGTSNKRTRIVLHAIIQCLGDVSRDKVE